MYKLPQTSKLSNQMERKNHEKNVKGEWPMVKIPKFSTKRAGGQRTKSALLKRLP